MDTIFALATARGKSGVAIVRISGSNAREVVEGLTGPLPDTRKPFVRTLHDADGMPLDQALVLTFDTGASFTGEQTVELHTHGSVAVVSAVLGALEKQPEARMAHPGEFTRRALENNRLDLAQVEGLADLIDSETEAQRRQALKVMRGALGALAEGWRADLTRAVALLEVTIDFADEEVPVDVAPEVLDLIAKVRNGMQSEADGSHISERIRDGFEVAIVGRPNVGKSTLLNRLAGRDAAITSAVAGTTRDVIEVRMDLNGLPVTLLDTAGLRDTADTVESLGIARARARADDADIRVFLLESGQTPDDLGIDPIAGDIVAHAKADLAEGSGLAVSGLTGKGIDLLLEKLADTLLARASGAATAIRARHRVALLAGISALDRAVVQVNTGDSAAELAAEEMRQALRAMNAIVGRVDVENILDEIFSSFCLGK